MAGYMWNPDEEDFELFLTSIHHVTKELLEKTEKFKFQVQLFSWLAMQYIDPVKTLRKIAEADHMDGQGRAVYCFRAFLGAKGQNQTGKAMSLLQKFSFPIGTRSGTVCRQ